MRFPVRRVLLGFAAGAAAGWVAGLLRTPAHAPAGSSADEATHLPQEEFGTPADLVVEEPAAPEHHAPRKATAPSVKPPPGSKRTKEAAATGHSGASEPAAGPEVTVEEPAPVAEAAPAKAPAKAPARKPRKPRATKAAAPDPAEAAAAALREGHAVATERLADAEAEATPPPDDEGPASRRRRRTT